MEDPNLPVCVERMLKLFHENHINCCISGGFAVYKAGITTTYNDIDVYLCGKITMDYIMFLVETLDFSILSAQIEDSYWPESRMYMKKGLNNLSYAISFDRITCVFDIYHFDIMLFRNIYDRFLCNFLFSEVVTQTFDLDVCCISIFYNDVKFVLRTNSNFKVFPKQQNIDYTEQEKNYHNYLYGTNRYWKYVNRLKPTYQIYHKFLSPEFSRLEFFMQRMDLFDVEAEQQD